jgi:hypothetical protein
MREITISTSALAELTDCFPNPEDPEPIGPWGPVIRLLDLVSLNPQPLPPAGGPEIGTALRRGTTWGGQPRTLGLGPPGVPDRFNRADRHTDQGGMAC